VGEVFSPLTKYRIKTGPESASPSKMLSEARGKSSSEQAGVKYRIF
jgi:hypothetical protein